MTPEEFKRRFDELVEESSVGGERARAVARLTDPEQLELIMERIRARRDHKPF